jgi:hypothetical protein
LLFSFSFFFFPVLAPSRLELFLLLIVVVRHKVLEHGPGAGDRRRGLDLPGGPSGAAAAEKRVPLLVLTSSCSASGKQRRRREDDERISPAVARAWHVRGAGLVGRVARHAFLLLLKRKSENEKK